MAKLKTFSFRKHFAGLCAMEAAVWDFDEDRSRRFKITLLTACYALRCLNKSNRALAAVRGSELLGVILFNDGRAVPLYRRLLLSLAERLLRLPLLFWGVRYKYSYSHFEAAAQKQVLDELKLTPDGKLVLLIVSPQAQGLGLGRQLIRAALEELKSRGCAQALLFTDDSCSYCFYDHLGFIRLFDRQLKARFGPQASDIYEVRFMAYGLSLKD